MHTVQVGVCENLSVCFSKAFFVNYSCLCKTKFEREGGGDTKCFHSFQQEMHEESFNQSLRERFWHINIEQKPITVFPKAFILRNFFWLYPSLRQKSKEP